MKASDSEYVEYFVVITFLIGLPIVSAILFPAWGYLVRYGLLLVMSGIMWSYVMIWRWQRFKCGKVGVAVGRSDLDWLEFACFAGLVVVLAVLSIGNAVSETGNVRAMIEAVFCVSIVVFLVLQVTVKVRLTGAGFWEFSGLLRWGRIISYDWESETDDRLVLKIRTRLAKFRIAKTRRAKLRIASDSKRVVAEMLVEHVGGSCGHHSVKQN